MSFWAPLGEGDLVFNEKALFTTTQSLFDIAYNRNPSDKIIKAVKIVKNQILEHPKPFSHWHPTSEKLADRIFNLFDLLKMLF